MLNLLDKFKPRRTKLQQQLEETVDALAAAQFLADDATTYQIEYLHDLDRLSQEVIKAKAAVQAADKAYRLYRHDLDEAVSEYEQLCRQITPAQITKVKHRLGDQPAYARACASQELLDEVFEQISQALPQVSLAQARDLRDAAVTCQGDEIMEFHQDNYNQFVDEYNQIIRQLNDLTAQLEQGREYLSDVRAMTCAAIGELEFSADEKAVWQSLGLDTRMTSCRNHITWANLSSRIKSLYQDLLVLSYSISSRVANLNSRQIQEADRDIDRLKPQLNYLAKRLGTQQSEVNRLLQKYYRRYAQQALIDNPPQVTDDGPTQVA